MLQKLTLRFVLFSKTLRMEYFYAHENNTFMERSKLVCTHFDMTNLEDRMQKMDFIDLCTRERANTNGNFTNLQI